MPIYEYQCKQCSERHEIIQRFSDPPVEHCPRCGGDMKKLFSSPAIQFKGSGFYKTDYASSGSSSATPASSGSTKSESKESKGETTKSESTSSSSTTKSETKSSE